MIKVTGLWLNEMRNKDEKYMSGSIGKLRIVILKNNLKAEGSNEPDYNLFFAEQIKKPEESTEKVDDDIPF